MQVECENMNFYDKSLFLIKILIYFKFSFHSERKCKCKINYANLYYTKVYVKVYTYTKNGVLTIRCYFLELKNRKNFKEKENFDGPLKNSSVYQNKRKSSKNH